MLAIKNKRDKIGLSQEELAKLLQVTQGAISQWERGESYPSTANLLALSKALGVPLEALIAEEVTQ